MLHLDTGQPITPDDLAPLFPQSLVEQEVMQECWVEIANEVQQKHHSPTPVDLAMLFGTIDAMPMRQQEMRSHRESQG